MNGKRKRCVAHFDVLGFSKIVEDSPEKAWVILDVLYKLLSKVPKRIIPVGSTGQSITDRVKTVFFSDTIVLYTEQDNFEDVFSLLITATHLFFESTILGIPLRGGIAHGDFFADTSRNLYMGVPLIKAYRVGDEAQWLGITLEHEIYEVTLSKHPELKYDPTYFVVWDVPIKGGRTERRVVVNWPQLFLSIFHFPKSARELYDQLGFSKLFGSYDQLQSRERSKYENTQNFIESRLKR